MVVTESISKKLVNFFSGFLDSMVNGSASGPFAKRKVEVLAEVGPFFFRYRIGSAFAALESWNTQLRQMRKSSLQPWQLSLRPGRPSSSHSFPQLWQCRFIRSMTCRPFGQGLDWA